MAKNFPSELEATKSVAYQQAPPNANSTQSPQTKLRTKNYSHPWAVKSKKRNRTRKTHKQPPLTGQYGKNESTTESGADDNCQLKIGLERVEENVEKSILCCVFFPTFFFLLIFHMRKVQPAAGGFGGAMAELQTPLKNNCQTHFSGGRGGWTETAAKQ